MQRSEGQRCPGSGNGYPHGKHKKAARRARAAERAKAASAAAEKKQ